MSGAVRCKRCDVDDPTLVMLFGRHDVGDAMQCDEMRSCQAKSSANNRSSCMRDIAGCDLFDDQPTSATEL